MPVRVARGLWQIPGLWHVMVCLLVSGCSLVPEYHRPDIETPVAWATRAPGTGAAALVPAQGAWWHSFGSTEIDDLMTQSLRWNNNLQAAIARIEQARATAEVLAAPLYPAIGITGTESNQSGVRSTRTHQVLGQASYELDFWGKNRAAAGSARALAVASAFDADTVAMTLAGTVLDTYFQVLSLAERVRLARQIASDGRHVLSLIEIQQSAGTATQLQVEQQRAVVGSFDAAVPALQQQSDVAIHALAVLTGQPPEDLALKASDLSGFARPDVATDLPSALLQRRPDVRAAEARLQSANFDIGVARAAFFPSLSLNAAVGIGARKLFYPPAAVTDVGASLLQPLFQGGQLQGQLRFDRARQVELVASYRQAVLTAFQDVEDQLSTLSHLRDQEAIVATAEVAAQKAAGLAEMRYRLGSADYLSVLTTEQTLYQAQDTLLQLRLLRLQTIVGLFRALGGGFDSPAGLTGAFTQVAAETGVLPPKFAAPSGGRSGSAGH
jgi:NodT family efflux transporter outer membrane factor (OMF) lipoprotein